METGRHLGSQGGSGRDREAAGEIEMQRKRQGGSGRDRDAMEETGRQPCKQGGSEGDREAEGETVRQQIRYTIIQKGPNTVWQKTDLKCTSIYALR